MPVEIVTSSDSCASQSLPTAVVASGTSPVHYYHLASSRVAEMTAATAEATAAANTVLLGKVSLPACQPPCVPFLVLRRYQVTSVDVEDGTRWWTGLTLGIASHYWLTVTVRITADAVTGCSA